MPEAKHYGVEGFVQSHAWSIRWNDTKVSIRSQLQVKFIELIPWILWRLMTISVFEFSSTSFTSFRPKTPTQTCMQNTIQTLNVIGLLTNSRSLALLDVLCTIWSWRECRDFSANIFSSASLLFTDDLLQVQWRWGPDENEFDPERWFSRKTIDSPSIGVYEHLLAFSAGVQSCNLKSLYLQSSSSPFLCL
jgi:hypothetical protein